MEDVVVKARLVGSIGHVERPSNSCLDLGNDDIISRTFEQGRDYLKLLGVELS